MSIAVLVVGDILPGRSLILPRHLLFNDGVRHRQKYRQTNKTKGIIAMREVG